LKIQDDASNKADKNVGKNFHFFKNLHTGVFEIADNEFAIIF